MKRMTEAELEMAAHAILTVLRDGSGTLFTDAEGNTTLHRLSDGQVFPVSPQLALYMAKNGFIKVDNAPAH